MPRGAPGPHAFAGRGGAVVRTSFGSHGAIASAPEPNSAPDAARVTASRPADRDDREPPLSVRRDKMDYSPL